jgi:hypothetical protein
MGLRDAAKRIRRIRLLGAVFSGEPVLSLPSRKDRSWWRQPIAPRFQRRMSVGIPDLGAIYPHCGDYRATYLARIDSFIDLGEKKSRKY